jgi:hypothetical protein
VVDAADYVVWRKGLGTTYTTEDYDVWLAHFGQSAGGGGTGGALHNAVVPETSAAMLLATGVLAAFPSRHSRTRIKNGSSQGTGAGSPVWREEPL